MNNELRILTSSHPHFIREQLRDFASANTLLVSIRQGLGRYVQQSQIEGISQILREYQEEYHNIESVDFSSILTNEEERNNEIATCFNLNFVI